MAHGGVRTLVPGAVGRVEAAQALGRRWEQTEPRQAHWPDPLARVTAATGGAGAPEQHAAMARRLTGGRPERAAQSLLQLQRGYGNRYVQRVVEHTHLPEPGTGRPLPRPIRGSMEQAFGLDFGAVRVHTDPRANLVNRSLGAHAFTRGQDIFFRHGEYDPGSSAGREVLAHELTHVVQQRAGGAKGTPGTRGAQLSIDPALESEADAAGARAARGEAAGPVTAGSSASAGPQDAVVQPKLGFELEMLVLTDIAGRPAPEKVELGTYGNLDLVVDRSASLVGRTPARAALAPFRRVDLPEQPPKKGTKRVGLGAYDLPTTYESRRKISDPKDPTRQDPRPVRQYLRTLAEQGITPHTWQERVLDQWVKDYIRFSVNWEQDLAVASLKKLIALGTKLMTKYPTMAPTIQPMLQEAQTHQRSWGRTALKRQNLPVSMEVSPIGSNQWSGKHPIAEGLTDEGYDSIVEIVTKPYDAETKLGADALIADMADAAALAGKIEKTTANFTKRVPLRSVSGVQTKALAAYIGSEQVDRGTQQTDASIQSTMAIDVKELYGFFQAGMGDFTGGGFQGQRAFRIKHQSIVDVARDVGRKAPQVAASVMADLQPKASIPHHLLGLFTLVAQYLLMGAMFEQPDSPQLDKNAVSLLSRTDLAKIYRMNVPDREKELIATRVDTLKQSLLRHTRRAEGDLLLTPESQPPLPQVTRNITCGDFITNIFTQQSDGFTPHLDEGIFKQMGPEAIPGSSGSGPVFELRNMIPRQGDRFPKDQWVPLTEDIVSLLTKLNVKGFWKELGF